MIGGGYTLNMKRKTLKKKENKIGLGAGKSRLGGEVCGGHAVKHGPSTGPKKRANGSRSGTSAGSPVGGEGREAGKK